MTPRSLFCILQDSYPEVEFSVARDGAGVKIVAVTDNLDEAMAWFIENTIIPLGINYEISYHHSPISDRENTWVYYYDEWHTIDDLGMEHMLVEENEGMVPTGYWISEAYGITVRDTDPAVTSSPEAPLRPPISDGVEYSFPRDGLGLTNGRY